jgi:uncharacterized protein
MILQSQISKLSNRLLKEQGGRRILESILERDYCSEKVFYKPQELIVLKNCEEFSDLPVDAKIIVYPLSEIASEKTVALLDRARTEPRDLYDLWYLTEQSNDVDLSDCLPAIQAKLLHRGKKLDDVGCEFQKKEARLKKMWETRLSAQMANLFEFDNIYRAVKRSFRQANITH